MEPVRVRPKQPEAPTLEAVYYDGSPEVAAEITQRVEAFGTPATVEQRTPTEDDGAMVGAPVDAITIGGASPTDLLPGSWLVQDATGAVEVLAPADFAEAYEALPTRSADHFIMVTDKGWNLEHPSDCVAVDLACAVYAAVYASLREDGTLPMAFGRRAVRVGDSGHLLWGATLADRAPAVVQPGASP